MFEKHNSFESKILSHCLAGIAMAFISSLPFEVKAENTLTKSESQVPQDTTFAQVSVGSMNLTTQIRLQQRANNGAAALSINNRNGQATSCIWGSTNVVTAPTGILNITGGICTDPSGSTGIEGQVSGNIKIAPQLTISPYAVIQQDIGKTGQANRILGSSVDYQIDQNNNLTLFGELNGGASQLRAVYTYGQRN
ncbi:MAG: hypothetical protein WCK98_07820 [bacterium]